MFCRKCRSDLLTKNGIVRGRQRYRCRSCGFNFTQEHSNGWPSSSKMLIVVSYCCGEGISDLAEQSGATPASVLRWIEEARESINGDGEIVEWMAEAIADAVDWKSLEHFGWLQSLFDLRRSDASRNPADAENSALVTERAKEISDKLRKSDQQA
jgi:hypothetical protein